MLGEGDIAAEAVAHALWSVVTPQRLAIWSACGRSTPKALRKAVLLKRPQRQGRSLVAVCFSGPQHVCGGVVVELRYDAHPTRLEAHDGGFCAADPVTAAATTAAAIRTAAKLIAISPPFRFPFPFPTRFSLEMSS